MLQNTPTRGCSGLIPRGLAMALLPASSLDHVTSVHQAGKSRTGEHVPGSQQGSFFNLHGYVTVPVGVRSRRPPSHPSGGWSIHYFQSAFIILLLEIE